MDFWAFSLIFSFREGAGKMKFDGVSADFQPEMKFPRVLVQVMVDRAMGMGQARAWSPGPRPRGLGPGPPQEMKSYGGGGE